MFIWEDFPLSILWYFRDLFVNKEKLEDFQEAVFKKHTENQLQI